MKEDWKRRLELERSGGVCTLFLMLFVDDDEDSATPKALSGCHCNLREKQSKENDEDDEEESDVSSQKGQTS